MGIIVTHGGPMDDAAALVEASAWLDEQEFARSYYAAMGGDEIRGPRTVTWLALHDRGHDLAECWSAPGWRAASPFWAVAGDPPPLRWTADGLYADPRLGCADPDLEAGCP